MIVCESEWAMQGVAIQLRSMVKGFAVAEYASGEWDNLRRFTSLDTAFAHYQKRRDWWQDQLQAIGGRA